MNSSTGEIYVKANIDREETPGPFQFLVIASDLDSNIMQRNSENTSVTVTSRCFVACEETPYSACLAVLDRNDNTPVFSEDQYLFNVEESTGQLSGIAVSANDTDMDENGMVMYTIVAGNEEGTFILGELIL